MCYTNSIARIPEFSDYIHDEICAKILYSERVVKFEISIKFTWWFCKIWSHMNPYTYLNLLSSSYFHLFLSFIGFSGTHSSITPSFSESLLLATLLSTEILIPCNVTLGNHMVHCQ